MDCGDLRDLEIDCHGGMGLCYPYYKKSFRRWGALEVTLHLEGHINNVVVALCVPAGVRVNVGLEVSSMQVDLCARLPGEPSSYWAVELKSLLCALWPGWNGLDDAATNRKIFGSFKQVCNVKQSGSLTEAHCFLAWCTTLRERQRCSTQEGSLGDWRSTCTPSRRMVGFRQPHRRPRA